MPVIIDGRTISKKIKADLKTRAELYENCKKIWPGLAIVSAGDDPASVAYEKNIIKVCGQTNVKTYEFHFDSSANENDVLSLIKDLNVRRDIHGIIVQMPLPKTINQNKIASAISPEKDMDCLNPVNSGKLFRGEKCFYPCTPKGIIRLLKEYDINPEGRKAVVVGRSNIVGKPVAIMLLNLNATVSLCHSKTRNLREEIINADIVVSAVGKPGLIKSDMIKPGAVIIDAGTTVVGKKLVGDVDFENVKDKASYITPVPGGVGSMTTAMLIENVLEAAENYE